MEGKIIIVHDEVSRFLLDPTNRDYKIPMEGLPDVGDGKLTPAEEAFLEHSTFEVLR